MSIPQPRSQDESVPAERTGSGSASGPVALPRMLTPFFGRDELVRRVVDAVTDPQVRLLTLTGPGGVGKTRLALRAAEVARPAFVDGVVFVPLASVTDPALVLPAIAGALGLTTTGDRPIADRVSESLGERVILLVLDNLEQLLAAAPRLAGLLRHTAEVAVLATSRAPLHIEGECELSVPALTLPRRGGGDAGVVGDSEAVHFFLERARAVQSQLRLTPAGWAAVHEIVRRLDGLPLALELAAARMKVLSAEALLVRLER